ncbi:Transcription factor, MADS-box [Dillenia turbinata]|uniref:Transcription factor, MADS-box n=1 Tax=Dillenia turbinata TaxID=194707 RepID=A0AAN8YYW8_9MAGN
MDLGKSKMEFLENPKFGGGSNGDHPGGSILLRAISRGKLSPVTMEGRKNPEKLPVCHPISSLMPPKKIRVNLLRGICSLLQVRLQKDFQWGTRLVGGRGVRELNSYLIADLRIGEFLSVPSFWLQKDALNPTFALCRWNSKSKKVKLPKNSKGHYLAMQRRKKSLFKKASELSTLCGTDVCIIVHDDQNPETTIETWPHSCNDVFRMVKRCKGRMSEDREKKLKKEKILSDVHSAQIQSQTHSDFSSEMQSKDVPYDIEIVCSPTDIILEDKECCNNLDESIVNLCCTDFVAEEQLSSWKLVLEKFVGQTKATIHSIFISLFTSLIVKVKTKKRSKFDRKNSRDNVFLGNQRKNYFTAGCHHFKSTHIYNLLGGQSSCRIKQFELRIEKQIDQKSQRGKENSGNDYGERSDQLKMISSNLKQTTDRGDWCKKTRGKNQRVLSNLHQKKKYLDCDSSALNDVFLEDILLPDWLIALEFFQSSSHFCNGLDEANTSMAVQEVIKLKKESRYPENIFKFHHNAIYEFVKLHCLPNSCIFHKSKMGILKLTT